MNTVKLRIGSMSVGLMLAASAVGQSELTQWVEQAVIAPDPTKVVVPQGYTVGVLTAGLSTPAAATVDGEGNVWVTISGNLFGGPDADKMPGPHVVVFDSSGNEIKKIGEGQFKTVLNEISYCAENGKTYIPEYGERIWEIDGIDGELTPIIKDLHNGDHRNGGITCRDGYIYFALGQPSNVGFADSDNLGWTQIPNDPFWLAHPDGMPSTPHDAPCRDIEHTGLNVRTTDGRLTGAYMPSGVPAKPGQVVKAIVPCHGSIMRVKMIDKGADGFYPHNKMEVYAFGFRNQSGVEFGPRGSRFENALAVSDNGMNDLGNRRINNGAEKLWIVTEMGQDGGFPDKEGMNFVTNKRFGHENYMGSIVERPHPNLYIGEQPYVPPLGPYVGNVHNAGVRGVPLIVANKNPNGYINPVLEWDTNSPIDGIAWSAQGFGQDSNLFLSVYGILTGPESVEPTWPYVLRVEFLEPTGIKWWPFAHNIEPGGNAYQEPENRGGLERPNDVVFSNDGKTMYIVDYGQVHMDFNQTMPFYPVAGSGVIWSVTYTGG